MPEKWEFTEEDAMESPPVRIHRAKLAATTEEQVRRKTKTRQEAMEEMARVRKEHEDREFERGVGEFGKGAKRGVGLASRLGVGLLRGAGLVSKHLKGIKTEDQYIKNKEFYGMGEGLNPAFTPLGRLYDRNQPMELYFGRRGRKGMPEGAQTVYVTMQQGYSIEQLEPITGLTPNQLGRAIQYLKEKNLWQEEWE